MALQLTNNFRTAKMTIRAILYLSVLLAIIAGIWMHRQSNASALTGELDGTSFITTWKTHNGSDPNDSTLVIPVNDYWYSYNYDVDWDNDGTFDDFGVTGDATHDYGTSGTYTVRIRGQFPAIYMEAWQASAPKLLEVNQWGTGVWRSMEYAFKNASNFQIIASDAPNLSQVTNMSGAFLDASSLNSDLSNWDVSNVANMNNTFSGATNFNGNISTWDVSSVTDMGAMFGRTAFNGDLSSWDVSNVTSMWGTFANTTAFNGDISSWDVSNVTDMRAMFSGATAFNSDLSNWDVSNVTNMPYMFGQATAFNGNISSWDTSSVTDLTGMFSDATAFNGDLSSWDVSSVTNMSYMFYGAAAFNGDLSNWDVSNVTNMGAMFEEADAFNGDLSSWDVSSVTNMSLMFYGASLFNGNISNWDVSNVINMGAMFEEADAFNGDLSTWSVGNVTNMYSMFFRADSFSGGVSAWDVSNVTDMRDMFYEAASFNDDLSDWDFSNVTGMNGMLMYTSLTPQHYDSFLISLANQSIKNRPMSLSAHPTCHTSAATSARYLLSGLGWLINDAGDCAYQNPDPDPEPGSGGDRQLTSVSFNEVDGKKYMVIQGNNLFQDYNTALELIFHASPILINGEAIPMCVDFTGMSLGQIQEMFGPLSDTLGVSPNISLTPTCVVVANDSYMPIISSEQIKVWLADDFDVTKPGAVTVQDIDAEAYNNQDQLEMINPLRYTFNKPVININGIDVENTPAISSRPTFTGTATPGATVTVTVHSDPVSCTTIADQDGNWSCTLPSDLVAGAHNVYVTVVNLDASVQEFGPYAVTVDGVAAGVIDNNTPGIPNTGFLAESLTNFASVTGVKHLNLSSQSAVISSFALAGAVAALLANGVVFGGGRVLRNLRKSLNK